MTVLPDIVREPTIISGKENPYLKPLLPTTMSSSVPSFKNISKLQETAFSLSAPSGDVQERFPNLIYNDKLRSTSYHRGSNFKLSDEDKKKLANSPLATAVLYNWAHPKREVSEAIKSKSKVFKPVSRIAEPARPPAPFKVNSAWETSETHFYNERRTLDMKRWQYLQNHTQWSIFPYAKIDERESYNAKIRQTLKVQMEDKLRNNQQEFVDRCEESKMLEEQNKTALHKERELRDDKVKYLSQFSVENKKIMEDKWMNNYFLKRDDWQKERRILNESPINWSKTLR